MFFFFYIFIDKYVRGLAFLVKTHGTGTYDYRQNILEL